MEIIDTQIHFGPGGIERVIGAMDGIGIHKALIDEYWGRGIHLPPGYPLAGGGFRATAPTAELACAQYPDRFSYLLRIHRLDPEVNSLIRMAKDTPHLRCLRMLVALPGEREIEVFADGGYEDVFAVIEEAGKPLNVFVMGQAHLLARYARKFPKQLFIINHCGLATGEPTKAFPYGAPDIAHLDKVLELAEHPNVYLQWSHAQRLFAELHYPYEGILTHLRRAINAYGAQRIMWASDIGGNVTHDTWAELLLYLLHSTQLTPHEKEWILGKTAKTVLDWN